MLLECMVDCLNHRFCGALDGSHSVWTLWSIATQYNVYADAVIWRPLLYGFALCLAPHCIRLWKNLTNPHYGVYYKYIN